MKQIIVLLSDYTTQILKMTGLVLIRTCLVNGFLDKQDQGIRLLTSI